MPDKKRFSEVLIIDLEDLREAVRKFKKLPKGVSVGTVWIDYDRDRLSVQISGDGLHEQLPRGDIRAREAKLTAKLTIPPYGCGWPEDS